MKTLPFLWTIIRRKLLSFVALVLLDILSFTFFPQLVGLMVQRFYRHLPDPTLYAHEPWVWCLLLMAFVLGRAISQLVYSPLVTSHIFSTFTLVRKNIFDSIFGRPGALSLPVPPGELVSRMRGDVDELGRVQAFLTFALGGSFFVIVALVMMARVNPLMTLALLGPAVLLQVITRYAGPKLQRYRVASRETTASVASFVREMFNSVLAVKSHGAEGDVVEKLELLNRRRLRAVVRDEVFSALLRYLMQYLENIGTAVILIITALSIRTWAMDLGDLSLFIYYLGFGTMIIRNIGEAAIRVKQAGVSKDRVAELTGGDAETIRPQQTNLHGPLPESPDYRVARQEPFRSYEAQDLIYRYGESGFALGPVDISIQAGEILAITGRIGSGKSTLLRLIAGLLPRDSGRLIWNGEIVADPRSFLLPPRLGYVSQVPRLISESLRDNILLGLPDIGDELVAAAQAASLDQDIRDMEDGFETRVGPRGVRLSGGQLSRAAAARMLVRNPMLCVIDDLSSALDVNTEARLWESLVSGDRPGGRSFLIVSHRKAALGRANRIIVLEEGRVAAEGTLSHVLKTSPSMQRIWET